MAAEYLSQQAERLRPGSYKAVRFAITLLTSECAEDHIGALNTVTGREVVSLIGALSPNIRKYRDGKGAGLSKLAALSQKLEPDTKLTPQTQSRILKHIQQFLDWCVQEGELEANPWAHLRVRDRPEVRPHQMLTDEQVRILIATNDRVLLGALLFGLLTGMRSGEVCGLKAGSSTFVPML